MGSTELTIFIDIVGRASSRWRGARSEAEAAEKNQQLSLTRASAVTKLIKAKLNTILPRSVHIVDTASSRVTASASKLPIQQSGVGSRSPIIIEEAKGNNPLNRSVLATLSYATAMTTSTVTLHSTQIPLHPTYWGLQVLEFDAAAMGVGKGYIKFKVIGFFGRTRRFEAELKGLGYDNPLAGVLNKDDKAKDPKDKLKLDKSNRNLPPDYDTVYFSSKPIGFDAFENNKIVIWKGKAGVGLPKIKIGVAVSDTVFGFSNLGGTSDSLLIDFDIGLGSLTIEGYRMTGVAKPLDKNPGDSIEGTIYSDELKRIQGREKTDSRIVLFETGDAKIPEVYGVYLNKWVADWADKFKSINSL